MNFLTVGQSELLVAFPSGDRGTIPHFVVVPPSGLPIFTRDVNLALRHAEVGIGGAPGDADVPDEMTVSIALDDVEAVRAGIAAAHPEAARRYDSFFHPLLDKRGLPQPSKSLAAPVELHREQAGAMDVVIAIVPHPLDNMRVNNRLAVAVSATDIGYPLAMAKDTEIFFDVSLAWNALRKRAIGEPSKPSGFGLRPLDHDFRNEAMHYLLRQDTASVLPSYLRSLQKLMIQFRLYETMPDIYEQLTSVLEASSETSHVEWLGTVRVAARGDGLWGRQTGPLELQLRAEVDSESIVRDDEGEIEFASCRFTAHYDAFQWHDAEAAGRDLPYTDSGVVSGINDFLADRGFEGAVYWSEAGRQVTGVGDFDMDYGLIDQIFPELRLSIEHESGPSVSPMALS